MCQKAVIFGAKNFYYQDVVNFSRRLMDKMANWILRNMDFAKLRNMDSAK